MQLGQFSVSLKVSDIARSEQFYRALGFQALPGCGSVAEKWLIMQNEQCLIGLFEGMLQSNVLTFNPPDVRATEQHLLAHNIAIDTPTQGDTGPAHCILKDPDGNTIMFDQF